MITSISIINVHLDLNIKVFHFILTFYVLGLNYYFSYRIYLKFILISILISCIFFFQFCLFFWLIFQDYLIVMINAFITYYTRHFNLLINTTVLISIPKIDELVIIFFNEFFFFLITPHQHLLNYHFHLQNSYTLLIITLFSILNFSMYYFNQF